MTYTDTKPKDGEKLIFEFYETDVNGSYVKHICYLALQPDDYICTERDKFRSNEKFYEIRISHLFMRRFKLRMSNVAAVRNNMFDYKIMTDVELKEDAASFKKKAEEYALRASAINVFLRNMNNN